MLLLLAAAGVSLAPADTRAIRAQRLRSNRAIAAHRYDQVEPILAEGYTAIPGSLGRPLDAAAAGERLRAGMSDPGFVTYLRTPRAILIAASRKRASESGKWVGIWRKGDGVMRLEGVYQATWVPDGPSWKLLNEAFVSLRCSGSKACADVD